MGYIKIEPNTTLKHYRDMSKLEKDTHIDNLHKQRYICSFDLCKTPMIIAAFGFHYKTICYFRAKNSHEQNCKWIIKSKAKEKIKIGSRKENESMERALFSLLPTKNVTIVDNIGVNNGNINRKIGYKTKEESTYIGNKISSVKTLPKDYRNLEENTKYKFLKKVSIKKLKTYKGKTIFYINDIFENEKISLEIKESCDDSFKELEDYFEDAYSNTVFVEMALVFIFEELNDYFKIGTEGSKICLWKNKSCILKIITQ